MLRGLAIALLSASSASTAGVTAYYDADAWRMAVKQYVIDDFESYDDEFPLSKSEITGIVFEDLPRLARPPAVYFGDTIGAGFESPLRVLTNFDDEPFFAEEAIIGKLPEGVYSIGLFAKYVNIKILLKGGYQAEFDLVPSDGYEFFGIVSDMEIQEFSIIGNFRQGDFLYTGTSIDDLHVSFTRPAQVTEPAVLGLLATGSLLALARRRRSIGDARSVPGEQSA